MIIHSLDELLELTIDQLIADRRRAFRTAILCDPDIDHSADAIDAAEELNADVLAAWRDEMRAELAAADIRFPLRLNDRTHQP
jgi:hypothetical protein